MKEETMIHQNARRIRLAAVLTALALSGAGAMAQAPPREARDEVTATMKRATTFMTEKLAYKGGYVWNYLPDLSRRWGEMEARETMIWIQPPGTATVGHLYLDAYHATGDNFYYQAAEQVAGALIWAQHPAGGWNYVADFAGERSLKEWYETVGKNGWRLEEFQHYWGNATFDDAGTAESAKFLLRLYLEKRDPKYRPSLDKAIQFVLDSQYPIGAWPQRYPRVAEHSTRGLPDYTAYPTFNDDVAGENIDFLVMCYQTLGDARLLDPILRGMNAFIVTQQGPPQPGWSLQYSLDLKPVQARTYEPRSLATHTTARNLELMVQFYRLTGDTKFLARVPEAIDWLESIALPPGVAPAGRTHATFIEVGTNRPLYIHREGSNVLNGRYYWDSNPKDTLGHYSSFRPINIAALRKLYADARAMTPEQATKGSPLVAGHGVLPLPKYFALMPAPGVTAASSIASLNKEGYWLAPLGYNSHPYKGDGSTNVAPGSYGTTHVGDESDTSPYPDKTLTGISIEAFIRNMSVLIRAIDPSMSK